MKVMKQKKQIMLYPSLIANLPLRKNLNITSSAKQIVLAESGDAIVHHSLIEKTQGSRDQLMEKIQGSTATHSSSSMMRTAHLPVFCNDCEQLLHFLPDGLLNSMEGGESAAGSYIAQRHTEMQANEGCKNCNCFLV